MSFTKVTSAGIGSTELVTLDSLEVINNASIGGVLTYEDVTNVDSVGIITARAGVLVGSGITLSKDGDVFFTGIATGNGSGLTALNASNLGSGTVPTARLGSGTASSSTFLRGDSTFQTVNTDLVSDTSPQLGGDLASNGNDILFADNDKAIFGTGSDLKIYHNGTDNYIMASNGHIRFDTGSAELARITSDGKLLIGTTTEGDASADNLTIADSGESGITVRSGTSNGGHLYFSDATSGSAEYQGAISYQHNGDFMKFNTGATERLRINSSGRVGIKNNLSNTFDSNANTLCIGDGGGAVGLTFYTAAAADGSHISFTESTGSTSEGMISYYQGSYGTANDRDAMIFKTNGGERLRINSSGQLLSGVTGNAGAADANAVFGGGGTAGTNNYGKLYLTQSTSNPSSGTAIGFIGFSNQDLDNKPFAFMGVYADADHGTNDYPSRFSFHTTADGGSSASERLRITSAGVLEYTQQSNVRTFQFSFSGGVGGSTTTQDIATLSNFGSSTTAVAFCHYVSMYGLANNYVYGGATVNAIRRSSSNSAWTAESNQNLNGGNSNAGPVVIGWDTSNAKLQFTCTAFVGYTIHVTLTVYNATCTINAL